MVVRRRVLRGGRSASVSRCEDPLAVAAGARKAHDAPKLGRLTQRESAAQTKCTPQLHSNSRGSPDEIARPTGGSRFIARTIRTNAQELLTHLPPHNSGQIGDLEVRFMFSDPGTTAGLIQIVARNLLR
jgi:hypothetical protein